MGLFSSVGNIVKSVTKPVKKVLKSPLGKAALMYGAYRYGPMMFGESTTGLRGLEGWQKGLTAKAPWLYTAGEASVPGVPDFVTGKGTNPGGILGKAANWVGGLSTTQKALGAGALAMGASELADDEPELPDEATDTSGHEGYLRARQNYLREWAQWKSEQEGISYEEALADLEDNPMFTASQGGRVKANLGLYAGGMGAMNQGMNPMTMNQGLGAPNLGSRSMGMTPGMGQQMDPRMAQMMQAQKLQGARRTGAVPKESEDTELIQLIKMLSSLGIPMEQLRGRTKEELVEMLVSVKGKTGGGEEVVEKDVIEEQDIREQQAAGGGLMRTGYAMGTEHPIIPSKDGQQLDMRDSGGYQPHGKAEKHDDVRALLAQGEFVMTSDAVKGMGGGDREQGAKKMYNLMHNMEAMA